LLLPLLPALLLGNDTQAVPTSVPAAAAAAAPGIPQAVSRAPLPCASLPLPALLDHPAGSGNMHSFHVRIPVAAAARSCNLRWSHAFLQGASLLLMMMGQQPTSSDQQLTVPLAVTAQRSMGAELPCTCAQQAPCLQSETSCRLHMLLLVVEQANCGMNFWNRRGRWAWANIFTCRCNETLVDLLNNVRPAQLEALRQPMPHTTEKPAA
jgi:hypothetical protein